MEPNYVISAEEVAWGLLLLTISMIFHGLGMVLAMWSNYRMQERGMSLIRDVWRIAVLVWIIVFTHLFEVGIWAGFLTWADALPNINVSYYFSLLQYTTVGSDYSLPQRWRLLEGLIAITGLLTFSWSTGIIFKLCEDIQSRQLTRVEFEVGTKTTR